MNARQVTSVKGHPLDTRWTVISAATFLVCIPLWMFAATDIEHIAGPPPYAALAVVGLAGVRLVWLLADANRHVYEAVLWIFVYAFLGCAPLVQRRIGIEVGTTARVDWSYETLAWSTIAVGCLAALIGSKAAHRTAPAAVAIREPRPWSTYLITWSSAAAALYFVAKVGFSTLFSDRLELDEIKGEQFTNEAASSILSSFSHIGILAGTLALIQLTRNAPRRSRLRRIHATSLGAALLLLLLTVNPFSSARFLYGTVMLSLAAGFGLYRTQLGYRLTVLAAGAGIFVAFPAFNYFRETGKENAWSGLIEAFRSGDFDAFSQVVNVADYVAHEGYTMGSQLLGAILFWVPRALWAGKPIDTGTVVAEYKGYTFGNLSSPAFSELYMDGGFILVFAGSLFLGYILRSADIRTELQLRVGPTPSILNSLLPFAALIAYRGSLLHAASVLTMTWVCSTAITGREKLRPWPLANRIANPRVSSLNEALMSDEPGNTSKLATHLSRATFPIVIAALVGMMIGGLLALRVNEQYVGSVSLSLRPVAPRGSPSSMDPAVMEWRVTSYKSLAASPEVTNGLRRLESQVADPRSSLRVSSPGGTSDLTLEVTRSNASDAQLIGRAWYDLLRAKIVAVERDSARFGSATVAVLPLSEQVNATSPVATKAMLVATGLLLGVCVGFTVPWLAPHFRRISLGQGRLQPRHFLRGTQ